jgi:hypothetical protein
MIKNEEEYAKILHEILNYFKRNIHSFYHAEQSLALHQRRWEKEDFFFHTYEQKKVK